MSIKLIDSSGLFNGDRFSDVSDEARLVWPHLWCASNGHGRIELNYHKVVGTAFARWKSPPTEEQFWKWMREFHEACLLFVYETNSQVWGQWDTSGKLLPKFKTAEDDRSPVPNITEVNAWKDAYFAKKKAKSFPVNQFRNVLKTFPLGIVVGIEVEKKEELPTYPDLGRETARRPVQEEIRTPIAVVGRKVANGTPYEPTASPTRVTPNAQTSLRETPVGRQDPRQERLEALPEHGRRGQPDGPQGKAEKASCSDAEDMRSNLESLVKAQLPRMTEALNDQTVRNFLKICARNKITPTQLGCRMRKTIINERSSEAKGGGWGVLYLLADKRDWSGRDEDW